LWALEAERARDQQVEIFADAGVSKEPTISAAHIAALYTVAALKQLEVVARAKSMFEDAERHYDECVSRARALRAPVQS
jgi:hypothetical protein